MFRDYLELKAKDAVEISELNDAHVLKIKVFNEHTGERKGTNQIAIDRQQIEREIAELESKLINLRALLDDVNDSKGTSVGGVNNG